MMPRPESIGAWRHQIRMLGVFSLLLLFAACTDVPNLPPGPNAALVPQSYLVQPGDTLDVKFVKNPELNEQPTVAPDGRISMLYAPDIVAAGKSTEAMRQELTDTYAKQLANYDVLFVPKTGVADVYTAYNQYFKQFLPSNIGLNFGTHFGG